MARASAKIKSKVKRKPVKAGRKHTNSTGGIFTTKVIAITKKIKNG